MKKSLVVGLACVLGAVTGCGETRALFNSNLERDSLMYEIRLDRPTTADKMKKTCRNTVPEVSSDLHPLTEDSSLIAFTNTDRKEFFGGTGEEYQLTIKCTLFPSKKYIQITADERGLPGSLKLKQLRGKIEQVAVRVKQES